MINKCPKCGFGQPQDQYCAKCGVDIIAYKAPPQPLLKKLGENLFIQLVLILFLGAGGVYWLRQSSLQSTQARVDFLKGSNLQLESSESRNQFEQPEVHQVDLSSDTKIPQLQADSIASETSTVFPPEVKIYFLQVSTATLNRWLEDETLTRMESSDGIIMGYVSELPKILNVEKGQLKVLKSETFAMAIEQIYSSKITLPKSENSKSRNVASPTDETNDGMTAFATLESIKEDSITGQLEISLDPQNSFPVQFEMSPGSSVVVTGFTKLKNVEKTPDSVLIVVLNLKK